MDEEADRMASQETPAAYLHLVDTRSNHQSQPHIYSTLAIDNDVDFTVSRNHCEIYVVVYEPTVNHVYVRDRKSSNGTFVNGQLIGSGPDITSGYLLQDGDLEECKLFASKYRVTDHCLGHGAEAVVCLANEVQTGRQLVCKLVNLDKIQGKNAQEDIRRKFQEADILRQLRHPNILPYTFTELASGGDLMSFLLRHDPVQEFDSRIIMRQVVRGLCYLHEKDIVHRDLKPENILLAYSPKIAYHRVMLSDFGNCAVPRRSRMITNVGTRGYQAPEFVMNGQAHTSAVDIWSLGVVALLLLASDHCDTELDKMDEEEIGEILSSWKPQDKLKPMPWVLQDLAQSSPPTPTRGSGSSTSQYFTTKPTQVEDSAEKSKKDRGDELDESGPRPGHATDEVASTFLIPARPSSARLSELEPQQMKLKQAQPPWHDFLKPNNLARTELPYKRKRVPKARVHDTAGLPLPGLDRHLRSPANYRHRQNILSALESTNSKFLVNKMPVLPSTPVDVSGTPMPASPKKRKSTYDVRTQGLAGANMPELPQLKFH
ncbi:hypothetical protein FSARC_11566 [Fusarium sarcochroum]|uniref:Uncharacterized protein n=1 Tax=Fusarium sarcochroum TaxID=1208366 RepID=A0A8H4TEF0_9HYPO|nr:hypothetical protein FSARC_11566 [Fusarium sarcochroum]